MLGFIISVTLIVQHSNVDARLGPLQKHLSIGRIHHLHHVNWGTEGDCNFGLLLTVWDRLLGTFHEKPPREITAKDLGVDEEPNVPKGYFEQFLFPLFYKPGEGEPERYRKAAPPEAVPTPAQEARRIVDAAEPPLRCFFGSTPIQVAEADYASRLENWRAWQPVAELAQG